MNTILLLNDTAAASNHAAELAFAIAEHSGANLLLADIHGAGCALPVKEYALNARNRGDNGDAGAGLLSELHAINERTEGYEPEIRLLPQPGLTGQELAALARKENINLIVKGFGVDDVSVNLNLRAILNRAGCPLLLVPDNYRLKRLERIVYVADLRYCKPAVLRYLTMLAKGYAARLSVAHISASGLPHPVAAFASALFYDELYPQLQYERVDYQLIKERDVRKAVDVLIHGMQTDLLVLENHQFHFDEIFGHATALQWPELCVPLLIFPG